ncbi:unnamed protein product [Arctogadus glacialis]
MDVSVWFGSPGGGGEEAMRPGGETKDQARQLPESNGHTAIYGRNTRPMGLCCHSLNPVANKVMNNSPGWRRPSPPPRLNSDRRRLLPESPGVDSSGLMIERVFEEQRAPV